MQALAGRVRDAAASGTALDIRGGGTKDFYGGVPRGEPLPTAGAPGLSGIRAYEPSELVVSVGAGTPLAELEAVLAGQGQCLPFEPPRFAAGGTVGGMVAAGLAGPARASVGGVRDYVLGATLLNGRGELMNFGGTVMKNVAGYDLSRVLAGSMGILGLICEVSLKVLPRPAAVQTLRLEIDTAQALRRLGEWRRQPLPLNASAWWDGALVLRLAGAGAAVAAAAQKIGGDLIERGLATAFWDGLRDHRDEFFVGAARAVERGATLWRLSVPATTPPIKLSGEQLIEWGGAQRWICTTAPASNLREAAEAAGGHAVRFRGADRSAGSFQPLKAPLDRIHRELKKAFDPAGIFNPGRLLPDL